MRMAEDRSKRRNGGHFAAEMTGAFRALPLLSRADADAYPASPAPPRHHHDNSPSFCRPARGAGAEMPAVVFPLRGQNECYGRAEG